jgi:tRNA (guanine37-N1)-methyltransferase
MRITYLSIFPEIFESFTSTTLISRAVKSRKICFETINPRHFCDDKHRVVDDEIYGGGHWLLMKAPPIIAAIRHRITKHKLMEFVIARRRHDDVATHNILLHTPQWHEFKKKFLIIIPHPSKDVFTQSHAHHRSGYSHLLFICGRYEVWLWLQKTFPDQVVRVSLGQFVTLGGELPAMTMTESVVRLLPWVINTEMSRKDESYSPDHHLQNLEHAQYTRPEIVEDISVPEVLLSWHHKNIASWKIEHTNTL